MSAHLRTAEEFDLYAIGALHQRSRVAAYAHIVDAETLAARSEEAFGEWWSERWKWERDTHRMTVAVASPGGEIVGFSYVGPSETPDSAELYAIHVAPGAVGTGVGKLLMINALEQLAEIGGSRAVLWVLEENAWARDFYERGGWKPDGTTRVESINGEPTEQLRYSRPL